MLQVKSLYLQTHQIYMHVVKLRHACSNSQTHVQCACVCNVASEPYCMSETQCYYAHIEKKHQQQYGFVITNFWITYISNQNQSQTSSFSSRDKKPKQFTSKDSQIQTASLWIRFSIHHIPSKLFRPQTPSHMQQCQWQISVARFFNRKKRCLQQHATVTNLPTQQLEAYKSAQSEDSVCSQVEQNCLKVATSNHQLTPQRRPYWTAQEALNVSDGHLLSNQHIAVPVTLQQETLVKLHAGHQEIQRYRLRSQSSLWQPKVSSQIQCLIQNCPTCLQHLTLHKEPMLSSKLPEYTGQKEGSDLFKLKEFMLS